MQKGRWKLLIEPLWNWNRGESGWETWEVLLLIEPLWNWNVSIPLTSSLGLISFNRTTMELKHFRCSSSPMCGWSFNRTTMELKQVDDVVSTHTKLPFNRTTMELKLDASIFASSLGRFLLIEPLWNWNSCVNVDATRMVALLIEPLWNWNPTAKHKPRGESHF